MKTYETARFLPITVLNPHCCFVNTARKKKGKRNNYTLTKSFLLFLSCLQHFLTTLVVLWPPVDICTTVISILAEQSTFSGHLPEAYRTPGYHKLCCTKIEQSQSQHTISNKEQLGITLKNLQYNLFPFYYENKKTSSHAGNSKGCNSVHLPLWDMMQKLLP